MFEKVSIIIPVYNGAKYLKKTTKNLLAQSYSNLEVLLVENNSTDNSWEICQELQKMNKRIRSFSVSTKGTSLARKFGVLQSTGTYIFFHDQDDRIPDSAAIEKMVNAIEQDQSDICQFGYVKTLGGLINKKKPGIINNSVHILTRKEVMDYHIKGVLGFGWSSDVLLSPQVWNKIYRADVVKDAVKNINDSLFFCEDEYLNIFSFFNELTRTVSVRNEYYYYWNVGVGFSASKNALMTFLKDYQYIKQASIPLIKKYSTKEVLMQAYWDSLMVYKWTIYNMLYDQINKESILASISIIEEYQYIKEAKQELRNADQKQQFKDIDFLSSSYSPLDFYEYCKKTLPPRRFKTIMKERIKKHIIWILNIIVR